MNFILDNLPILLIIYCVIFYIVFMISCYFIFAKANIDSRKALIPFVNFYYFMNVCHLSWWWLLVPIINFLILFFCPMLIAYHFDQKRWLGVCGVFFPIPFYLYIALTNSVKYIHKFMPDLSLKKIDDIDRLENKIMNQVKSFVDEKYTEELINTNVSTNNLSYKSEVETFIKNIDSTYATLGDSDEFVEDILPSKSVIDFNNDENKVVNDKEILEIIDDNVDEINLDNIENLESISISNNAIEKIDNSDYVEIKENERSVDSIAFDSIKKNQTIKQEKELTCPNCGSLLIGFHDHCPGCNMDIRDLTRI